MPELTNSQIDKLGDRLRKPPHTESDLRLLEEYKRSFAPAYKEVIEKLRARSFTVMGRPEKSMLSIVSKLQRGSMKLSRMQDIAGCRIIVADIVAQNRAVEILQSDFPTAIVKDRRVHPSFGYRAVHIVANIQGKALEIQVRSALQHRWAEFSEKLSDAVGIAIKYGGGPSGPRGLLSVLGQVVAVYEELELEDEREQKAISEAIQLHKQQTDIVGTPESAQPPLAATRNLKSDVRMRRMMDIRQKLIGLFEQPIRLESDAKEKA